MNIKTILEKQNIFWLIVVGIALIIFGLYLFIDIQETESNNGIVIMKRSMMFLYNIGGKFTILALFEFVGLMVLIAGIKQLKNK